MNAQARGGAISPTPLGLRLYLARHLLEVSAVARHYPCDHSWVSHVLRERVLASPAVLRRLCAAAGDALAERQARAERDDGKGA